MTIVPDLSRNAARDLRRFVGALAYVQQIAYELRECHPSELAGIPDGMQTIADILAQATVAEDAIDRLFGVTAVTVTKPHPAKP